MKDEKLEGGKRNAEIIACPLDFFYNNFILYNAENLNIDESD
jgi:hypothetical protein